VDSSKILILGSNGQLGKALAIKYPNALAFDSDKLDITNKEQLQTLDLSNIDLIINAAAYTNVDGSETSEGRIKAWQINASGASNLTELAILNDLTLIHISSDYVFDGTIKEHSENEKFSPLGVYGQTKAAGDIVVNIAPKHFILRTSWVIGDGNNFIKTMLSLGKKGINPKVVNDQIGRLTFTSEIVKAIDFILMNNIDYGTYNISNGGTPKSWAEIAQTTFDQAGYPIKVTGISTKKYFHGKENIALRPEFSTLSLDKLSLLGFSPYDWEKNLGDYLKLAL